jgi:hypothetical protein
MSWTGCEQQRVASPRGVACIIVRIARAKVKKVVEKIKEERAERENSLFFVFLSKQDCFSLHEVMCARGAPKMCLDASKNSLNSTQFSLQFSQNSITLLLFLC